MTPVLRDAQTLELFEAELVSPVTATDLVEAEKYWVPVIRQVVAELFAMGKPVRAWQGKWRLKEAQLTSAQFAFLAIRAEGKVQGFVKLIVDGYTSNAPTTLGKPLVYVDFLESAPWNVKRYMDVLQREQRFKDVGRELIRAAIYESLNRGFGGRIGLHSLPEAEGFYQQLGMVRLASDATKGDLVNYELDDRLAQEFYGDTK